MTASGVTRERAISNALQDSWMTVLHTARSAYPAMKLILTGHHTGNDVPCDAHVEGYAPDKLLVALRDLFPTDAATVQKIEQQLEKEAGDA